jgi:WD40 repeat protein
MIWNVSETSPLYNLSGHNDSVQALSVINNEYLTSCSNDKTIKLWSLSTYEEVRSWRASDDSLNALAFDPKLNVLVSSGSNNEIKVWDSRLWTNNLPKPGITQILHIFSSFH